MSYFLIISITLTTGMLWSAAEEKKELLELLHMIDNASQQSVPLSVAVGDMTECVMTAEMEERVRLTFGKKRARNELLLTELKQQVTAGNGAELLKRESDLRSLKHRDFYALQSCCKSYESALNCFDSLRMSATLDRQFNRIHQRIIESQMQASATSGRWVGGSRPILDEIEQQAVQTLPENRYDALDVLQSIHLHKSMNKDAMSLLPAVKNMITQRDDQSDAAIAAYIKEQKLNIMRLNICLEQLKDAIWEVKHRRVYGRLVVERHRKKETAVSTDTELIAKRQKIAESPEDVLE